jgi:dihydrodipicolinate synthase/N-acetylneuraminate lyase
MIWKGIMPAMTTPFDERGGVDTEFLAEHCRWLIENDCTGIVALGSLGEGATLGFEEKLSVLSTCVRALNGKAPVVAAVAALSTNEAVRFAKSAQDAGCNALMILPPYVYPGDWREIKAHVAATMRETQLPCMLYNNPIAYGTDFSPEHIAELAQEHENLEAVKESSADVRRVSGIRALLGERLAVMAGVDDTIVEAVGVGASGWVAGLANALPRESAELFNAAMRADRHTAARIYRWFLPLLRMDTVPKFVQLIKLVQAERGSGYARVRPPRLELAGAELQATKEIIRSALAFAPQVFARACSSQPPLLAR